MRKLFLLFLAFSAISCHRDVKNIKAIEKYKGCVYMGWAENVTVSHSVDIYVKHSDSLFVVEVLKNDVENLRVGDTIK